MQYHLCCNQLKGSWEVRNSKEEVIYNGTLKEASDCINGLVKENMGVRV
ncbi:hypothetical protein [Clostridium septicum]|uniref:Uncharacterized protein n=1 Tax=Clostridium septicum TaxID=1504 RepID=A0ABY5B2Y6_CLOSE|nr:hypothetical protein [Clostridium septicum]UEC20056.1 hypothetical protein LK444_11655 [Clostridium septicum]USS01888.1 hypothetical protein NH397_05515 [Clostridium septicum]WLF70459.1 hypothetical protein Q6375_05585 [Clostridium septicum]